MEKAQWEVNPFDTELFGFRVAKILHIPLPSEDKDAASHLIHDLKIAKIRYATYRFPATNIELIHALESHDFHLVDGFMEMEISLTSKHFPTHTKHIQIAAEKDIPILSEMVKSLFTLTRFYLDPVTRPFAADEYAAWIKNSIDHKAADAAYIWKDTEKIIGFIAVRFNGHIPLVFVSSAHQGAGIGRKLVSHVLHLLQEKRVEKCRIEAPTMNIPAVRSYQACGFQITKSFVTLRWHNEHTADECGTVKQ